MQCKFEAILIYKKEKINRIAILQEVKSL